MNNLVYPVLCGLALASLFPSSAAVLTHSDVVFMYQADRKTYDEYGATVLGWGGKPTPKALEEAKGVKFFGSVGMVTEFGRYYERFPQTYEQGLCRDINGQPVKVPWLTDHQHKGIPFWWCCTQQPQFRQYLSERVIETVKAGADGVHIDDHMGTAGGLWLGQCFCERCVQGFSAHLKRLPMDDLNRLGIEKPDQLNYRDAVRQWLALETNKKKNPMQHPLWSEWAIYQCRAAANFMQELRELAAKTAGHTVPMGANAGLLWPRHLGDYKTLDLFSAETDHHASQRHLSDRPLVAYRLAEAVHRPYAATASGGDWAFIKEQNLPGLVRGWIALSYAAGQFLMAPHRQWCYTPQKGTHWYQGPAEKFAPLYQFVRRNARWFDNFETHADLAVVLPYRAFVKNSGRWFTICDQLAAANISYRILLAGDEIVDCPLTAAEINACKELLVPERNEFLPTDRQLLEEQTKGKRVHANVQEALAAMQPAVQIKAEGSVRALPRVKAGVAVIHLLNYQYDSAQDNVTPLKSVRVRLNTKALGIPNAKQCILLSPEAQPISLQVQNGEIEVPSLGLWAMLCFDDQTN